MADSLKPSKRSKRVKNHETVRERVNHQSMPKAKKDSKLTSKIYRPLSVLGHISQKEYNPINLPNNRTGRFLGKHIHVHIMPKFIKEAWLELKRVDWPSRRVALHLTATVVLFAAIFAIFVQIFAILFQKLVQKVLLKS